MYLEPKGSHDSDPFLTQDNVQKYGYLRQDDSGHWYLIPEKLISKWTSMLDEINSYDNWEVKDALYENVNDEFGRYRLSGGIQDIRVPITE